MGELWFVTGGARSGKSAFAEQLARDHGGPVVYVATMEPSDQELELRVARHREARPESWATVEEPLNPIAVIQRLDPNACVILDCLSLWLNNRLREEFGPAEPPAALDAGRAAEIEAMLDEQAAGLLAVATERRGPTIVVTNEVGSGVVPAYPLGRLYRDALGRLNQRVAAHAARAWVLVAGRALPLPPAMSPRR